MDIIFINFFIKFFGGKTIIIPEILDFFLFKYSSSKVVKFDNVKKITKIDNNAVVKIFILENLSTFLETYFLTS